LIDKRLYKEFINADRLRDKTLCERVHLEVKSGIEDMKGAKH
jgi:hypothetical protein